MFSALFTYSKQWNSFHIQLCFVFNCWIIVVFNLSAADFAQNEVEQHHIFTHGLLSWGCKKSNNILNRTTSLASNCNTIWSDGCRMFSVGSASSHSSWSLLQRQSRNRTRLECPLMNSAEIPPHRYCFTQNYKYGEAACDRATVWQAVCTQVRQNTAR